MSLPYFPMYPTDFEAKTSHLTMAEDGAYNRLLRLMWMTPGCSLPDNDAWIKRRMRCTDEEFEAVVLVVIDEFLTRSNGRLSSAKLTREFIKSNAAHKKRVNAGAKGGKAKALKTNTTRPSKAKAKPKQPEPEPEPYKKEDSKESLSSVHSTDEISECVQVYNAKAEISGWPKVQTLSKPRRSALNARLKECGGIDGWSHALEMAAASEFLTGQTSKPFFASFDWLTKQANFTKLMEGNYVNRSGKSQFGAAHREYTRQIREGIIKPGPDPSDPFAGLSRQRS